MDTKAYLSAYGLAIILASNPASAEEAKKPLTCTMLKEYTICTRYLDNYLAATYIRSVINGKPVCSLNGTGESKWFEFTDLDCDKKVDTYRGNLTSNEDVEQYGGGSARKYVNFDKIDTLYDQLRQETLAELLSGEK